MPKCEAVIGKIFARDRRIRVTYFPRGARVKLILNKLDYDTFKQKIIYEDTQTSDKNTVTFSIPSNVDVQVGNSFTVEVSSNGYKTYLFASIFQ